MTLLEEELLEAEARAPRVVVLADRCAGCQECVIRCPTEALSLDASRWVAEAASELCVGCRQCVRTCPFSAIVVEGPAVVPAGPPLAMHRSGRLLGDVSETRPGFSSWEEVVAEASRCLSCPDPTCVLGCPAHNDIPGFIAALRRRDARGALEVLRATSVMPDICSRVCNQAAQCEGACSWSLAGERPVAIGKLERFAADAEPLSGPRRPDRSLELSVGVVGSGPAGIAAAWKLAEAGASVVVYEKDDVPGGLLNWGIPDFTLPKEVARRPWQHLDEAGVELVLNHEVDPDQLDALARRHDAVVVAAGASVSISVPVPGSDLAGVLDATAFLKASKEALRSGEAQEGLWRRLGYRPPEAASSRVVVLGAGNTALDVARGALRLGLRATCVDWVDERFALARPDELAEARAEGVEVAFLRTLARVIGDDGKVTAVELSRTRHDRPEERPQVLAGPGEWLDACLVVRAMGYRVDPRFNSHWPQLPPRRAPWPPDRRWMASGIFAARASKHAFSYPVGELAAAREVGLWEAQAPRRPRVWAAGDVLVGASTVVEAMAQGIRAAQAVLEAMPRRPGAPTPAWERKRRLRVVVCYESRTGRTEAAAGAIASSLEAAGHEVRLLSLAKAKAPELAWADALVVGSWVEGAVVAGVRPAKAARRWLAALPWLGGRPVALFCTYRFFPKGALEEMEEAVLAKGGQVVAKAAFGPSDLRYASCAVPARFGSQLARLARFEAQV
jgi:glutamate synthase (NADPH/NADH) small chain